MYLYLLITVLTVGLACFVDNRRLSVGQGAHRTGGLSRRQGLNYLFLWAIFVVLFLLSALRLEVGNDYGTYTDVIHEIYVGGYVVTEPLFNALVKLLCLLYGGENYLLVFGIFAFVTVWLFVKLLYEQSDSFVQSFFLFMTLGIYFRTFNTVRYYFVLALALFSFRYVLRREYGKFLLLIGFGALFHKSVLVVIPLYLLAALPWKKWHIGALAVLGGGLLIFQDQVMELALLLYPSYRNTIYLETESGFLGNVLTIIRCLLVLFLSLYCFREGIQENPRNCFYAKLNLLALGIYSFASFLPLVGRIGYYLISAHVLLIPGLLASIESQRKKNMVMTLVVIFCLLYFAYFLWTGDREGIRILPYKSWLFYEKDFLNAGEIF